MVKDWIQNIKIKHGALRRQLQVSSGKDIPKSLLTKISKAEIGKEILNPTKTGKKIITVTKLLKRRAVLARNMEGRKR